MKDGFQVSSTVSLMNAFARWSVVPLDSAFKGNSQVML